MPDFKLDWKGEDLKRTMKINGAKIISEFALTVEAEAKKELRRGHGVLTGTLRRSIHTALPGYDWGGDDVDPAPGTPERGRQKIVPPPNKAVIQVGSGLKYAMAVNQGHHSFVGYHYLTNGLTRARAKLPSIITKYRIWK